MFQRVTLIGYLGGDPAMRYVSDGTPVTTFSVATSEKWGKGDDKKERTTWWRVTAWQNLAEICNTYLHKGSQVYVEGTVTPDENGGPRIWADKDGTARASFEITAREVKFLGGKGESF